MLKKYFLFISLMIVGLFAVQNCEAAYFCRCIKSKANETVTNPYNGAKHSSVVCKFDKKQVTSLSVTISDKDACVKYCKKNKSYIGSMDHGVCKDNLCPTNGTIGSDGNRSVTLFNNE